MRRMFIGIWHNIQIYAVALITFLDPPPSWIIYTVSLIWPGCAISLFPLYCRVKKSILTVLIVALLHYCRDSAKPVKLDFILIISFQSIFSLPIRCVLDGISRIAIKNKYSLHSVLHFCIPAYTSLRSVSDIVIHFEFALRSVVNDVCHFTMRVYKSFTKSISTQMLRTWKGSVHPDIRRNAVWLSFIEFSQSN